MEIKNIHIDKKQACMLIGACVFGIILGGVITLGAMHSKQEKNEMGRHMSDRIDYRDRDFQDYQNFGGNQRGMMRPQQGGQIQIQNAAQNNQPVIKLEQQGAAVPPDAKNGNQAPSNQ